LEKHNRAAVIRFQECDCFPQKSWVFAAVCSIKCAETGEMLFGNDKKMCFTERIAVMNKVKKGCLADNLLVHHFPYPAKYVHVQA